MSRFLTHLIYRDVESDDSASASLGRFHEIDDLDDLDNPLASAARETLFEFLKEHYYKDEGFEHEKILEHLKEYTLHESEIHSGEGTLFVVHSTNNFFQCYISVISQF